ncbi:hypothetical protein PR202_ga31333 [Eleusine coracana subsp. coracana]|uniref:Uncharacterized protein n=1 Tax=Eleusine coracana subsp. coracana TaxID=191504 RepID=A0AAV5DSW1_ELECO|nr:hypothetical protein PR202_ga31333 [Eleusine coracana subsp. coracana]
MTLSETVGNCLLCRETSMNRPFVMLLTFHFSDGCGCSCSSVEWPVDFQKQKGSFITDRSLVLRELHCAAEQQSCAGQQEILERESLPRVETCTHAIVTNIVRYATEDDKVVPLKDNEMKYSSSSPTKRHIEDTAACSNSAQPKKLKYYFLKDEKLKC